VNELLSIFTKQDEKKELTNNLNIPQKRQFHYKYKRLTSRLDLKNKGINSNIPFTTLNNKNKKYFSTEQKLNYISVEPKHNYILPALNLANCWEPLYQNISQSAGNLLSFNFLKNFRGHTPKYFGCRKELLTFPLYSTFRFKHTDKSLNKSLFSYYLAGLIEGDGSIITPKTLRSPKGKLNYPSIQITFHLKDLPLALLIQKELGLGSLCRKKGIDAYVLTINSYEGILLIISLVNGKMRTPKIHSLNELIDFFNKTKEIYIEKHSVSIEPLNSNS
jgi:hypothetical protein